MKDLQKLFTIKSWDHNEDEIARNEIKIYKINKILNQELIMIAIK